MSIYLSAQVPRWEPQTEQDLQQAIDDGLIQENSRIELKASIPSGQSHMKELARDLAQFAIDGGTVIVGVAEQEGGRLCRSPVPLSGLAERVDSVARSRPDPPLAVECREIRASSDDGTGYLVISVPPSPAAPHMVDGRYLGRGDKTKIYLTDAEILRLHERRESMAERTAELLHWQVERDPVQAGDRERAHLFLVARPLAGRDDMFVPDGEDGSGELRRLVRAPAGLAWPAVPSSVQAEMRHVSLATSCSSFHRRSSGVALASSGFESGRALRDGYSERSLLDLQVGEDGTILLFFGGLSHVRPASAYEDRLEGILDGAGVVLVVEFLGVVANVAASAGYLGAWGFGMSTTGIQGVVSSKGLNSIYGPGPSHDEDHLETFAAASLLQLQQQPGPIAGKLLGRFLRGLGVEEMYKPLFQAS